MRITKLYTSLITAAFMVSGPASTFAQEAQEAPAQEEQAEIEVANGTRFGDWMVACEAVSTRSTVCHLTQELTRRDTGELVVRMVAMPVEDGTVLLAQVPMGVYLPGGAVFRIAEDEEESQREMIWQRCLGALCEAAYPVTEEELTTLTAGGSILFGYRMDLAAEPIVVSLDMSSFADGINALR